jgi:predicted ATPase
VALPIRIWFVDLAPIVQPSQVLPTIMKIVGIAEMAGVPPLDSLITWFRSRQCLLVLDNMEHVLEAAPQISALLQAVPTLQILVTSRLSLRLQGEQEYLVEPLRLPQLEAVSADELLQAEAVQLFVQRAQSISAGCGTTQADLTIVANICQKLQGLPLAIELAAARVRIFTLTQLLAQLQSRLLPQLTSTTRDLPRRQQTMRATIEWSYQLLSAAEQQILARMAIFAGGCSIAAVDAICRPQQFQLDAVTVLTTLVEHHVVRRSETDGEPRFLLFETIREYALECLQSYDDESGTRLAHARYMLAFAEQLIPAYWWSPNEQTNTQLDSEIENLRTALRWLSAEESSNGTSNDGSTFIGSDRTALGLQLITATHLYWENWAGRREGYEWLRMLYVRTESLPFTLRLKGGLAFTELYKFYDGDQAEQLVQLLAQWLPLVDDAEVTFWFYAVSGWVAAFCKTPDLAIERWNTGLVLARQRGARRWEAEYLTDLSVAFRDIGDYQRCEVLLQAAVQLSRAINDLYQLGEGLFWLTNLMLFNRRDCHQAKQYAQECRVVAHTFGNRRTCATIAEHMGYILFELGDWANAEAQLREALSWARIQGNVNVSSRALYYLGKFRLAEGDAFQAAQLLPEIVVSNGFVIRIPYRAEQQLLLGRISVIQGNLHRAVEHYQASLMEYQTNRFPYGIAVVLESIAALAANVGEPLQSALFGGAAESIRATATEPVLMIDRFTPILTTIADQPNQPAEEAWERAWQSGTSLPWQEATGQALTWLEQLGSEYPVQSPELGAST